LFFGNDFDAARQIALDLQLKSIWCANSDYNYFSFISVFLFVW
jgi:hypothetical protein